MAPFALLGVTFPAHSAYRVIPLSRASRLFRIP
jgi:hypothetical protein